MFTQHLFNFYLKNDENSLDFFFFTSLCNLRVLSSGDREENIFLDAVKVFQAINFMVTKNNLKYYSDSLKNDIKTTILKF